MDIFIMRFDTFQALANCPEDQLIELLEQNADWQIIERLILEKGCYISVADFQKDLKQAGSQKQPLNFIKSGTVERAKTGNSNAMDIDATQSGNNKCFNCGRDHFTKECKKPTLLYGECTFLGSGDKKDCFHCSKGGCQAHSTKKEKEGATSCDEDKSIKKKKKDKDKGQDWSKSIQEMSLDDARARFKDYKNLTTKSGKA